MNFDYDRFHEEMPDPRLTFFNYGYLPPEEVDNSWILPEDHPDRHCLNMVRKVLGDADISGARVLEVGCGRGGNCSYLSRYGRAGFVIGLDRCESAISFCSQRFDSTSLRFLVGNAESIPFSEDSFDLVLNLESAHCYEDFAAFLSEVHRVLAPGGLFCFADAWDMTAFPIDWSEREKLLKNSGLEVVLEADISRGVAEAIEAEDNLADNVVGMAGEQSPLIKGIVKGSDILRNTLTLKECRYMSWILRK